MSKEMGFSTRSVVANALLMLRNQLPVGSEDAEQLEIEHSMQDSVQSYTRGWSCCTSAR